MRPEFWEAALQLPSVRRLLGAALRDLGAGRTTLILLPPGVPAESVWAALAERLGDLFRCVEVEASEIAGADAVGIACTALRESRGRRTLREIVALPGFPEVIRVREVEALASTHRRALASAMRQWAELGTTLASGMPAKPLLIICAASALLPDIPPAGPALSHRYWWGIPSALEARLLCREMVGGGSADWIECVVAGLGAGDLVAADALTWAYPQDVGAAIQVLGDVGRQGSLHRCAALSSRTVPRNAGRGRAEPPQQLLMDWAAGRIVSCVEYGTEPHPAFLALHEGADQLERRLWRSQAQTLLPLADAVRIGAGEYLMRTVGPNWYAEAGVRISNREQATRLEADPSDAELGQLSVALYHGGLWPNSELGVWRERVDTARLARNDLAHYRTVTRERFEALLRAANGL